MKRFMERKLVWVLLLILIACLAGAIFCSSWDTVWRVLLAATAVVSALMLWHIGDRIGWVNNLVFPRIEIATNELVRDMKSEAFQNFKETYKSIGDELEKRAEEKLEKLRKIKEKYKNADTPELLAWTGETETEEVVNDCTDVISATGVMGIKDAYTLRAWVENIKHTHRRIGNYKDKLAELIEQAKMRGGIKPRHFTYLQSIHTEMGEIIDGYATRPLAELMKIDHRVGQLFKKAKLYEELMVIAPDKEKCASLFQKEEQYTIYEDETIDESVMMQVYIVRMLLDVGEVEIATMLAYKIVLYDSTKDDGIN